MPAPAPAPAAGAAAGARVIVVGAGMAGLRCATELHRLGLDPLVLEAGDAPGGRVRTDDLDGFLVDRGFQVLLTAYPEAQAAFDYAALDLRPFVAGAMCRRSGRFASFIDPLRNPIDAAAGLLSPVGGPADLARVIRWRHDVQRGTLRDLFARPEVTALERLEGLGFSEAMLHSFWRPFLSGVFLDAELGVSSRLADFVVRMFSQGTAAVPAGGMGALSHQLAARLPAGSLRLNARVEGIEARAVTLAGGERIEADAVVVATAGLLPELEPPSWRAVTTYSFDAAEPPVRRPILVLDGSGAGPVNNLHVASQVAPATAPAGRSLVSATVLGLAPHGTEQAVRAQLRGWYGTTVDGWRLVQELRIERALPVVPPRLAGPLLPSGIYACGDHLMGPTLNAALATGRRAAAAVARRLAAG